MDLKLPVTLCYVDDDAEDLMIFEEAVTQMAAEVKLFKLGVEFLLSLQSPPMPSIVFLDLNMPHFTGFQVLQFIKKNPAFDTIPIIILSTAKDPRSVDICWEMGANFYIVKPNDVRELSAALEFVINVDWPTQPRDADSFVFKLPKALGL